MSLNNYVLVAAVALVLTASGQAAVIDWMNASGSNAAFSWAQGQSGDDGLGLSTGLWGEPQDPATTPEGFNFNAIRPEFVASTSGNGSITSEMDVDVVALNPIPIPELHIIETGTFTGDMSQISNTAASVEIFQLVGDFILETRQLTMTFFPNGTWVGEIHITDPFAEYGGNLTNFSLSVINTLVATAGAGPAEITKTDAVIRFPEPGTLGLLMLGIVSLTTRRARR